jgi:hypothetical protein
LGIVGGRAGSAGRSCVAAGVGGGLEDVFSSRSLRLLAAAGCEGGGSDTSGKVLALTVGSICGIGRAGRVGKAGGDSSSSETVAAAGGLLKGERGSILGCTGLVSSLFPFVDNRRPGFSARFTGGGTIDALASRSLLNSTDLLGGGGEGGCDTGRGDDRLGSGFGVVGRLGTLKGREEGVLGVVGVLAAGSGLRAAVFAAECGRALLFGGECGGSIKTAGGLTGLGLSVGRFACWVGRGASPCSPEVGH